MIAKIITGIVALFFSLGLTVLMEPHFAVYVKSEIMLSLLLILSTIVGWGVIYTTILQTVLNKKEI
jgi:hypothetical protein